MLEWEEWGNPVEDPEIYAVMKSYSPYDNVRSTDRAGKPFAPPYASMVLCRSRWSGVRFKNTPMSGRNVVHQLQLKAAQLHHRYRAGVHGLHKGDQRRAHIPGKKCFHPRALQNVVHQRGRRGLSV